MRDMKRVFGLSVPSGSAYSWPVRTKIACLIGAGLCIFLAIAGSDMDDCTTLQFVTAKLFAAVGLWTTIRYARYLNAEGKI